MDQFICSVDFLPEAREEMETGKVEPNYSAAVEPSDMLSHLYLTKWLPVDFLYVDCVWNPWIFIYPVFSHNCDVKVLKSSLSTSGVIVGVFSCSCSLPTLGTMKGLYVLPVILWFSTEAYIFTSYCKCVHGKLSELWHSFIYSVLYLQTNYDECTSNI